MLEPLDLTPMLAKAEPEQWLAAIKAWRAEKRRDARAIIGIIEGIMAVAVVATLVSRHPDKIGTIGGAFGDIIDAAVGDSASDGSGDTLRAPSVGRGSGG